MTQTISILRRTISNLLWVDHGRSFLVIVWVDNGANLGLFTTEIRLAEEPVGSQNGELRGHSVFTTKKLSQQHG